MLFSTEVASCCIPNSVKGLPFLCVFDLWGRSKLLKVMGKFMALIAMMVSWAHTYLLTHQVVYIKYLQLFVCPLCLQEIFLKANK